MPLSLKMENNMLLGNKVTVFGGTGFVGNAVINELSKAGYHVNVVVRRPERYREVLLFPNAKLVTLDSFDETEALKQSVKNVDTVINLTVDRSTGTEMIEQEALSQVAQKIKSACESAGVKRVLSLSQIGASNDAPNTEWRGVLGEVDNLMHNVASAQSTVFKASLLIGAGDCSTQKFIDQLNRIAVLPVANSKTVVQPLWIKDFAKAMVSSIKAVDTFGKKLDVVGEERLTFKQLAELTSELMQKEAIVFGMCAMNAKIMAALSGFAPVASVSKAQLINLAEDMISDEDFSQQFGFVPSSLEWIIAKYASPSHVRERLNYFRKEAGRDSQDYIG